MAENEARLTRDDAMTLLGHAEYLRKVYGEEEMPRFFNGLANRILALLSAPQETPNVCEKCGYVGSLVEHPGCNYQAGRMNPWPPAPAALAPAVREAAELRRVLSAYDEWNRSGCVCEPAYCAHLVPLLNRLQKLSALDSNGGA